MALQQWSVVTPLLIFMLCSFAEGNEQCSGACEESDVDASAFIQQRGVSYAEQVSQSHRLAPHDAWLATTSDILTDGYHWTMRGANARTSSYSHAVAPTDFSKGPSAIWNNTPDEQVRHSPLIDQHMNIYVMTGVRILKLNPSASVQWEYFVPDSDGLMSCSPAIYNGALYGFARSVTGQIHSVAFSLNMTDGGLLWKQGFDVSYSSDSQGLLVYNDTVLAPIVFQGFQGSTGLLALNTTDGTKLWEYVTDDVMWNFKPSTPGDGSIIFSSSCGAVHRIDFDGGLIWKREARVPNIGFCTMGGGSVGPNNEIFYTEYSESTSSTKAYIDAWRIRDGTLLWSRTFNDLGIGGQYPAAGYFAPDGPPIVVAGIGSTLQPDELDLTPASLKNNVVAMNGNNGSILWQFSMDGWPHSAAAGDFGKPFFRRFKESMADPRREIICLPDPQGIPLISGDGYVYITNSQDGKIHAVKDMNFDGHISTNEVSTFAANITFLNSPSVAPGMLVAAPAWGPMYIFKDG